MKITLTREEVEKLISTISWVNVATQDSKRGREILEDIVMKLRIGLKSMRGTDQVKIDIVG